MNEKSCKFKDKFDEFAQKENGNHFIVNSVMVGLLALVLLFSLLGGVRVNIGATQSGVGDYWVRQNVFQLLSVAGDADMSIESATDYVNDVNAELYSYGVMGINPGVLDGVSDVATLAEELKEAGVNPNKINWIRYKYALAIAASNETPGDQEKSSWEGNRAVSLVGQAILYLLPMLMMGIVSLVMLIFAVIDLIKRKENKKINMTFILLTIAGLAGALIGSYFGFFKADWSTILNLVLIFVVMAVYIVYKHFEAGKHEISPTMLIHNGVLLGASLLSFILCAGSMFKVVGIEYSTSMTWAYLYDLILAESAYLAVPMAYTLQSLICMLTLGLPAVLSLLLFCLTLTKFITCNYQHNEKQVFVVLTGVVSILVSLLVGINSLSGNLGVTSLYYTVTANAAIIIQPIIYVALAVFVFLFKVKPIKKELVFA